MQRTGQGVGGRGGCGGSLEENHWGVWESSATSFCVLKGSEWENPALHLLPLKHQYFNRNISSSSCHLCLGLVFSLTTH